MKTLLQDLRYALRQLRRSPGFALTAVLTLGLGIGANTAMYTVIQRTLLKPLPYPEQQELVGLGFDQPGGLPYDEQTGETAAFLQINAKSFSSVGIADDQPMSQNLTVEGGSPQVVRSLRVSAGYLPTLGIVPLRGRTFSAGEDIPNASPTAVISEALWRGTFSSDPNVLGRTIQLNGDTFQVVGIMPDSLKTLDAPDVWQPLHLSPTDPGYKGDNFQMIGRLRSGVSLQQATAEIATLTPAVFRAFPAYAKWTKPGQQPLQLTIAPLRDVLTSHARSSIIYLTAAVGAVLLLVCLNLGGLLIARSESRKRELAIRISLGAGRWALVRLLVVENVVLALGGVIVGAICSEAIVPALFRSTSLALPALQSFSTDWEGVAFAFALGLLAVLFFGVVPPLRVLKGAYSVAAGARTGSSAVEQQRMGKLLLASQVTLTTMLLSVAALLFGTFLNMRSTPLGMNVKRLYAGQVSLQGSRFKSAIKTNQFIDGVVRNLQQDGSIKHVAAVNGLPLDRGMNNSGGPVGHPELIQNVEGRFITPGYFATVSQQLLIGQDFSSSDTSTAAPVVIVNRYAARLWFSGQAIGQSVIHGGGKPKRIIGVVADAHGSQIAEPARPTIYEPFAQLSDDMASDINGWFPTTFVLQSSLGNVESVSLMKETSQAIRATDAGIPLSSFYPMQHYLEKSVATPRFFSNLAIAFGFFALFLTVLGTYGLLSYQASSRAKEFAIRMALGSRREGVLLLVVKQMLLVLIPGLLVGAAASLALRRTLQALLSQTLELRPSSLLGVIASPSMALASTATVILVSGMLASLFPAMRAAKTDPNTVLRSE